MSITAIRPALAVLAAVALPVVAPSPAFAAAGNGVCEAGEFCVYREPNQGGPVMDWRRGVDLADYDDQGWPATGVELDDSVSSIWNRSSCRVSIWSHDHNNGPGITVAAGGRTNAAGTALGDDSASSHNACP